jgi:diguanylate cyclase (GGDEF)-like protein
MSEIAPRAITEIQRLASALFARDSSAREQSITDLISLVSQHLKMIGDKRRFAAAIAVFFDAAFSCLQHNQLSRNSELYKFFIILNHLPVLENSPFYAQTLDILSRYFRKDPSIIKLFDRLQLLYLYTEIGNFEAAKTLAKELEKEVPETHLSFFTLYQICRFKVYDAISEVESKVEILLRITTKIYDTEGDECALFLMGRWLCSLEIIKGTPFYRALLCNLYDDIKGSQCLNAAMVGYELFSMDDRLISPDEKLCLYEELMEYKESVLNAQQLNSLHFFAGNYMSGKNENFRDSIQSFKSSNYFLHKCWERLIGISRYLRLHCNPVDYKLSVGFLDKLYLDLSHQTSMRNNSYVENLQTNFDKIEDLYREVGELSLRDALTGLRNRRYMENNLTQIVALAFRHNAPVSFAMMDIDHFKRVNDTLGHAAGDYVLQELSKKLLGTFRKSDIIIRYGGEEFLVVLFDIGPEKCMKMMQDLREDIQNQTFQYQRHSIRITISIGLSYEKLSTSGDCCELDRFVQNADAALYEAKAAGRNQVVINQKPENPA